MRLDRTRIAAAGTVLALGGLAAVALGSGGGTEPAAGTTATTAAPVRTEVVRRTVHVPAKGGTANAAPTAPATVPAPAAPASVPVSDDDHGRNRGRGGDDDDFDDRYDDHGGGDDSEDHGGDDEHDDDDRYDDD